MTVIKFQPGNLEEGEIEDPPEYVAFKTGGEGRTVRGLEVRTRKPLWPTPGYRWLLYTLEDGEEGTSLALTFSCMQITVRGKNLRSLATAIKRHRCAVLWEYNPDRWPLPRDPSAAFIEAISIHMPTPLL